jgi:predicted CoA-binding protein
MNSTDAIQRVLAMTTWFVVGLGNNPGRDAYWVADALQRAGRRIVPIHPRAEVVLGEQAFRTIAEAAAMVGVPDVVDLFVNSSRAPEFVDAAIDVGAQAVWFQLGVHDAAAEQRAEAAGLTVIVDRCPKIELWRT